MTDNDNWQKIAGNLHQGLTEALRDKQRVLVLIGNAVAAYRRDAGCMSSADYHGDECICLRCSMQRLEALLTDKKNVGDEKARTTLAELTGGKDE